MFIATVIVSIVLAVMAGMSGVLKIRRVDSIVETMMKVGVRANQFVPLAVAEFAGGVGLIVGLFWWPVGVAASVGLVIYFVVALGAHARVGDREISGAAMMLALSGGALALRIASA